MRRNDSAKAPKPLNANAPEFRCSTMADPTSSQTNTVAVRSEDPRQFIRLSHCHIDQLPPDMMTYIWSYNPDDGFDYRPSGVVRYSSPPVDLYVLLDQWSPCIREGYRVAPYDRDDECPLLAMGEWCQMCTPPCRQPEPTYEENEEAFSIGPHAIDDDEDEAETVVADDGHNHDDASTLVATPSSLLSQLRSTRGSPLSGVHHFSTAEPLARLSRLHLENVAAAEEVRERMCATMGIEPLDSGDGPCFCESEYLGPCEVAS